MIDHEGEYDSPMHKYLPGILVALGFLAAAYVVAVLLAAVGSSLFGDWRLVFQQLQEGGRFWLLGLACAVAVACIVLLFQYEQHLISRSLGYGLLALRLSLILVLFLTLLEPVWTWSYDEQSAGRLLVAVDVSESMETRDAHAGEAERLRWAKAIGLIGQEAQARFDRWLAALEEDEEPEWVLPEEEADPVRRERLAQARKANFHEQLDEMTRFSRMELALRTLGAGPQPVVTQLERKARTELALFGSDFARIEPDALENLLRAGDPDALSQRVMVDRRRTDLTQPLNAALTGEQEERLAGIVILTDGQDTSGAASEQVLSRMAGLGLPVHTVLVGSEQRPRDLAIAHVDHPQSVFKDDAPRVNALIQTSGFENEELTVYLESLDDPDQEPMTKRVTPAGPAAEVAFSLDKLEVGRHRFRVRTDVHPEETRDDNNSRDFSISVVDDRAQVLLIEGEGRWEFRFLKNALDRDDRVAIEKVLFDQPYLGVLPRPFYPRSLTELELDREGDSPYAKFDLIIVGDVSPRDLPLPQWRQLEKYVREEGGTLALLAGKRFLPRAYAGTAVDGLLPIERLRTIRLDDDSQTGSPPSRGFRLSVTPDGQRLPMFQLADGDAESQRIWNELPGHQWGIVGEAKGGASVWATARRPGDRPDLEQERQEGLIVQHYVGTGQVVWIGLDSTWRWRYRVGDAYHHQFWGQLVRWAVSFKATAGNENVRLGLRESVINVGTPATIQARWDDRFLSRNRQLKARAVIEAVAPSDDPGRRTDDGRPSPTRPRSRLLPGDRGRPRFSQKIDLTPQSGNPLLYEGQAVNLEPGEYLIRLEVEGAELGADPPEAVLIVNDELSPELRDVSANRSMLEEIARLTGGEFLLLDELTRLPELLDDTRKTTAIREEIPLWSHWLVLLLFCTFATAEWVLRKLNGLP
jgi:hypothetical protein